MWIDFIVKYRLQFIVTSKANGRSRSSVESTQHAVRNINFVNRTFAVHILIEVSLVTSCYLYLLSLHMKFKPVLFMRYFTTSKKYPQVRTLLAWKYYSLRLLQSRPIRGKKSNHCVPFSSAKLRLKVYTIKYD